ncbi:MAG: indolepyruvate ferredoxin oxidoreductase family protein [Woeseiaceae bacterium]|nr:indolepyruvate ferredoxin oxidoreductase family protein [Woeseiaceae bacterium]
MAAAHISLNDKYELDSGRVFVTGTQALLRLAMVQRRRDAAAGLNTAGFISGYRGSPMTAIDVELWRAKAQTEKDHIRFWPATNEHMAATALWGTQQVHYYNDANYDGVFGMWYGKGPGLDQSLDAMRQGNYHGTSKHGGVLVLAGDDPAMRSTVDPYHSELLFEDLLMPVLYPADIQEVFDLGLYGFELSRFSGCWVGYKLLPETIETAASIRGDHDHIQIVRPDFEFPPDGVNSRLRDMWSFQEIRMRQYKIPAAVAFARANNLNRISHNSRNARFGIAAMGKTWRDTLQALEDLGLDRGVLEALGIRILKVAMPWPVDRETYAEFAEGLDDILVIEDKREQIENALRDVCYAWPESRRPRIVGRRDESGQKLVDDVGDLSPDKIVRVIAQRIGHVHDSERMRARIAFLDRMAEESTQRAALGMARLPYFCSGCPHNTSTKVPEGSRAFGGVGCHFMANWMERDVYTYTQMGGEGVTWIGQAPFVKTPHTFQQLGDGTYYHSGILAIRSAVAARVNITYKILYNDAVAMTGGQPVDGQLTVPQMARQVRNEGIERIAIVTDEPEKYPADAGFPDGATIHHRDDLDFVQRELRDIEGVTVLIYDQTCAAEKRRRRKRGTFPDPAKRMFINDRVCEGCGDCGKKSNCVSVLPVDTEYGKKRKIDQSSCNKDYSCNNGFCPSFVTVLGGSVRKGAGIGDIPQALSLIPEPEPVSIEDGSSYGVLIGGVGGTGVVTIGALLGMAAHIDGIGTSIVDQLGFAQKGGPVTTHIRFANSTDDINSPRINAGSADLVIGCDMLVVGGDAVLDTCDHDRTTAIMNTQKTITGDFTRDPDLVYPADTIRSRLEDALDDSRLTWIDASAIATKLLGDSIGSNLFLVGYAWQRGLLPLSRNAIFKAIELNGVKAEWNQQAFEWGRRAAHNLDAVLDLIDSGEGDQAPKSLDELIEDRATDLIAYQDEAYAKRYRNLVARVREAEQSRAPGKSGLAEAVARYSYKLMAYKDEYEVARLYSDPEFRRRLNEQFEGNIKLQFNLSPPAIAPKDKVTGLPRKMTFGGWMMPVFGLLARLRFLRGTVFDLFGRTDERKMERQLIVDYEATVDELLKTLDDGNYELAVKIAAIPEQIRGYGHVKEEHIEKARICEKDLLDAWRSTTGTKTAA